MTASTTPCLYLPTQGTGLGKALKIIAHPVRSRIPVWVAALGEKNVALTAEVADGWLPILFIPERAKLVWGDALDAGTAKRDPALGPLQISAGTMLAIGEGDDVVSLRELARPMVALYVGGMGAKGKNFYNTLACRYGYEQEAEEIQDLYLAGRKKEAEAKVPDEFLELTSLVGPAVLRRRADRRHGRRRGHPPAGHPHPGRRPDAGGSHRATRRHGQVVALPDPALRSAPMPPAAKKAPLDYLFAIATALFTIGTSFLVEPPTTKYIVMITGIVMLIAVLAAAAKPQKVTPPSDTRHPRATRS